MTRKDYELIAQLIREGLDRANDGEGSQAHRGGERAALWRFADNFAMEAKAANSAFNRDRFLNACSFPARAA